VVHLLKWDNSMTALWELNQLLQKAADGKKRMSFL